jgi:hypothetical protein
MYEIHVAVAAIRVQGKTFADICTKIPIADIFQTRRRRDAVLTDASAAVSGAGDSFTNSTTSKDDDGLKQSENKTAVASQTAVGEKSAVGDKPAVGDSSGINEDHYDSLWEDYDYDETVKVQADAARSQVRIDFGKYGPKKAGDKRAEDEKVQLPDDIYCDLVNTLNDKCLQTGLLSMWKYNRFVILYMLSTWCPYVKYGVRSPKFFLGSICTAVLIGRDPVTPTLPTSPRI